MVTPPIRFNLATFGAARRNHRITTNFLKESAHVVVTVNFRELANRHTIFIHDSQILSLFPLPRKLFLFCFCEIFRPLFIKSGPTTERSAGGIFGAKSASNLPIPKSYAKSF